MDTAVALTWLNERAPDRHRSFVDFPAVPASAAAAARVEHTSMALFLTCIDQARSPELLGRCVALGEATCAAEVDVVNELVAHFGAHPAAIANVFSVFYEVSGDIATALTSGAHPCDDLSCDASR